MKGEDVQALPSPSVNMCKPALLSLEMKKQMTEPNLSTVSALFCYNLGDAELAYRILHDPSSSNFRYLFLGAEYDHFMEIQADSYKKGMHYWDNSDKISTNLLNIMHNYSYLH